jgi:hypothetical protein
MDIDIRIKELEKKIIEVRNKKKCAICDKEELIWQLEQEIKRLKLLK